MNPMKKTLVVLAGSAAFVALVFTTRALSMAVIPEPAPFLRPEPTEAVAATVSESVDVTEIKSILTSLTALVSVLVEHQSSEPLTYTSNTRSSERDAADSDFTLKQADAVYDSLGDTNDDLSELTTTVENLAADLASVATELTSTAFVQEGNAFGTTTILGTRDDQDLQFVTNGEVQMVIGAGGAVAIGIPFTYDSYGLTVQEWGSPSSSSTYGGYFTAIPQIPDALLTETIGLYSDATISLGQMGSNVRGLMSVGRAFGGTATNVYGLQAQVENLSGSTITNAYGIRTQVSLSGGGTTTNAYGVYISSVAGTNTWGLYQSSATNRNYFAGNVNIGTTATGTNSKLTVVSTNVASTTLRLESPRVAIVSGNILGGIDFASNDTNLTTPGTTTASILARANETHTASALGTDLIFSTTNGTTTAERLRILGGGSIGIGTSTPSAQLTTTGTVRFAALGSAGANLITDSLGNVTASSDERLKDLHDPFTRSISDLVKIKPITYTWKPETGYDTATVYTGFSAQNVQAAIPEAVATDTRGYLTLAERPILATVVNAIKEMWEKVMGHDAEIESLKEELRDQQAEIRALQDALNVESLQDNSPDLEDESVDEGAEEESLPVEESEEIPETQTPNEIDLNENTTEEPLQSTETVVEPETFTEVPAV